MQGDALDADEVLAAGDALGDGELDRFLVWELSVSLQDAEAKRVVRRHTVRRPGGLARGETTAAAGDGADLADLEPHVPHAVPRVDVLAVGDARHVEGDGPEVGHGRHGDETELVTGGDGGGGGARPILEAADVLAIDVAHAVIVLVILGLTDRGPFLFLGHAVDNEFGKAVCSWSGGFGRRVGFGCLQWASAVAARSSRDERNFMLKLACRAVVKAKMGEKLGCRGQMREAEKSAMAAWVAHEGYMTGNAWPLVEGEIPKCDSGQGSRKTCSHLDQFVVRVGALGCLC